MIADQYEKIKNNSECLAILQGHTSLVGQLQMRGDTLVTGGSDGSVRVWSLERMCPIHRLAAHDNSVTSLQFDDTRVVSGGSDGRVKIWDLKTGHLVRELIAQGEAVWRVAFEEEKCVALALRQNRTVMEVSWTRMTQLTGIHAHITMTRFGHFHRLKSHCVNGPCPSDHASCRLMFSNRRAPWQWTVKPPNQAMLAQVAKLKTSTCRTRQPQLIDKS